MRICFVAEGSYPYMVGGISSWLRTLMKCLPGYELKTYAIGANEKDRGKYAYTTPYNMTSIKEVFLDEPYKKRASRFAGRFIRCDKEKEILMKHFTGNCSDWPAVFDIVSKIKKEKIIDFFNCSDFFEIVRAIYDQYFENAPFGDFLWSIRTMYINQFYVLKGEIPEADVYHSVLTGLSGAVASYVAYLRKKPFILTEHGIYTREREEEIIRSNDIKEYIKELWVRYFKSMSECAYYFADRIVTQHERNRDIQIGFGADRKKTMIIPNGINADDYDCSFEGRLFGEDIVVGAIARIVPIKDIITMLEAYTLAREAIPGLKLVIIGPVGEDLHYNAYIQNYIKERNLSGVIFTGKIGYGEYIHALYSFDIFLLTSISEGQPISILEAMASGKPVVATDVGSCGEMVHGTAGNDGEAGIIVPVMDPKTASDAIIRLASDMTLRKRLGEAGRRRVREYYSIDHMKDSYIRLYESVAN